MVHQLLSETIITLGVQHMFLQVSSSCVSSAVGPADATSGGGSKSGMKLLFYLTESVGDQPLLLVEVPPAG